MWQKTEDADPKKNKGRPKNYPDRMPLTVEEREKAEIKRRQTAPAAKPPPLEQVKQWLEDAIPGWSKFTGRTDPATHTEPTTKEG